MKNNYVTVTNKVQLNMRYFYNRKVTTMQRIKGAFKTLLRGGIYGNV